jgi:hypothetical protein
MVLPTRSPTMTETLSDAIPCAVELMELKQNENWKKESKESERPVVKILQNC